MALRHLARARNREGERESRLRPDHYTIKSAMVYTQPVYVEGGTKIWWSAKVFGVLFGWLGEFGRRRDGRGDARGELFVSVKLNYRRVRTIFDNECVVVN